MVQPAILFDGKDVQVRHYPAPDAQFRLISFDIMHARASGRSAFALSLAAKNNIDMIAVVPHYPCWYPKTEMEIATQIIRELHDRPSLAYGASMGGYGALRWGRTAGAQGVLACSPQFSIDPAVTGTKDRRYHKYFLPQKHTDMDILPAHLPQYAAVLYDPHFAQDHAQAGWMAILPGIDLIATPFMAHSTTKCVSGSTHALALFQAVLAGDSSTIRKRVAQQRRRTATRRLHLAQKIHTTGRLTCAQQVLNSVSAELPIEYHMTQARFHLNAKKIPEAITAYQQVLAIRPNHPLARRHLEKLIQH